MMDTMEVLGVNPQDDIPTDATASASTSTSPPPPTNPTSSQPAASQPTTSTSAAPTEPSSGYSTPTRRQALPAITSGPSNPAPTPSPQPTSDLDRRRKKKGGLTPEQKAKLDQIQKEQEKIRQERVSILSKKLLDKISVWIESERSPSTTEAFKTKMEYEAEILKLESFGVDLLHAIGLIYTQKATTCLKSSKFLGLGGVWFRTKERGTLVKSAWGTMTSAVDASIAAEKISKMEEEQGKYTDEQLAETMLEFSGKMLMVGWKATKLEVIQVIRWCYNLTMLMMV